MLFFTIWQNFELTLTNMLCFWANLHSHQWQNIKKYSSHLVTLNSSDIDRWTDMIILSFFILFRVASNATCLSQIGCCVSPTSATCSSRSRARPTFTSTSPSTAEGRPSTTFRRAGAYIVLHVCLRQAGVKGYAVKRLVQTSCKSAVTSDWRSALQ